MGEKREPKGGGKECEKKGEKRRLKGPNGKRKKPSTFSAEAHQGGNRRQREVRKVQPGLKIPGEAKYKLGIRPKKKNHSDWKQCYTVSGVLDWQKWLERGNHQK